MYKFAPFIVSELGRANETLAEQNDSLPSSAVENTKFKKPYFDCFILQSQAVQFGDSFSGVIQTHKVHESIAQTLSFSQQTIKFAYLSSFL
jgi:hypothetical protein